MGYTTEFHGRFEVTPPLKPEHTAYLKRFAETRRVLRDAAACEEVNDPIREAAGLRSVGPEGGYFTGEIGGPFGRGDNTILNYNQPPVGQPGLWCQWVPSPDGRGIEWDGNEKFYYYTKWLVYLISHFLKPWGYTLNGTVDWRGEDFDDIGSIRVTDNEVTTGRWFGGGA